MDEADASNRLITTHTFSNLLAAKQNRRSALYQNEPARIQLNHPSSAKQIIQTVIGDVEKMNKADFGGVKTTKKDLAKKYKLVPLNLLAPCPLEPKQTHIYLSKASKCESQGVTDTQMLDAADGADAVLQMISHKGMTQMFDVSFTKNATPNENYSDGCHKQHNKSVKEENYTVVNNVDSGQVNITEKIKHERINNKNQELTLENIDDFEPLSPILTPCLKTVETRLPKEIKNNRVKRKLSEEMNEKNMEHIYKRSKSNDYVISKDIVHRTMQNETHHVEKNTSKQHANILNKSIEDEIIFSSDEEYGVKTPKKFLSLTCKINKNVHSDTSNILDESLYVFFTTASDKPIQVSRDSFEKAKKTLSSLLEEDFEDNTRDLFLKNKADKDDKGSINDDAMENIFFNDDPQKSSTTLQKTPVKLSCKTKLNETFQNYDTICEENKYLASKVLLRTINEQKDVKTTLEVMSYPVYDLYCNQRQNNSNSDSLKNVDYDFSQKCSTSNQKVIKKKTNEHENTVQDLNIIENEKQHTFESEEFRGFETRDDERIISIKETIRKAIEQLAFVSNEKAHDPIKELPKQGMQMISEKNKGLCFVSSNTKSDNQQHELLDTAKLHKHYLKDDMNMVVKNHHQGSEEVLAVSNTYKQTSSQTKNIVKVIDDSILNVIEDQFKPSNFQGFKTASNKQIKISDLALAKSINLFKGIANEINYVEMDQPGHSLNVHGISPASDKQIIVSEQAFDKPKNIFEVIDTDMPNMVTDQPLSSTKFQGFKTASNKQINVPEKALAKSNKLFEDIDTDIHNMVIDQLVPPTKFKGFSTASNKQIKVSVQALAKSKNMFQDIEHENMAVEKLSGPSAKQQRFISAISKIKNFNKQIKLPKQTDRINDFFDNQAGITPKFPGFTTASNKKIKVSEEALAKSKALFSDEKCINKINVLNENTNQPVNSQNIQAFATSPNNVIYSQYLINDNSNIMQNYDNQSEVTELRTFQGFTTASNKTIKVSEDALAKTRNIFQEFDDIKFSQAEVAVPKFGGFTTASNKNVKVSKEALNKTKAKFEEIPVEQNKRSATPEPKDFKTSNYKNINISLGAPETFKKHLEEDDISTKSKKYRGNTIKERVENNKINCEELLNTQIKNNFEETLYSEDFALTPKKTCGSPILPCSSAKKRRTNVFKVPYRIDKQIEITTSKNIKEESPYDPPKFSCKLTESYKNSSVQRIKIRSLPRDQEMLKNIGTLKLDFNNLSDFKFDKRRNDLTDSELCIKDLSDIFLNSVDSKIVPSGWVQNHVKLILWKLISYESFFPDSLAGVTTAKNVLQQLKYRYDRELNKVERPILRKILEMDEAASRYMVLCVVRIFADGQEIESVTDMTNLEMEVTDGWYCVRATIDKTLSKAIVDGKLLSGTKIATHGAELLNCGQGMAPWEDISSVRLKLSGNSTRRAAWHERLGARGAAPPAALRRVTLGGGRVGALRAHVARVYPPLYLERFDDGNTVTRSERLEALHAARHEAERAARLERACEEAEREFTQPADWEEARECPTQVRALACRDPTDTPTNLTDSQVRLLNDYSAKKHDRILEKMQARIREKIEKIGVDHRPRNVVSLLKVRLCGWHRTPRHGADEGGKTDEAASRDGNTGDDFEMTKAILSIWKPSEYLMDVIKEGVWIDAMTVVPTAVRMSELHISAGRQSVFRKSHRNDAENASFPTASVARKCIRIKDFQLMTESPTFNEVDTVGLIVQIDPTTDEFDKMPTRNQNFQNVYLADSERNFACVNFWGGLKKFGYEKIVEKGQFLACLNLQMRMGNSRKSTPQFRVTELSTFTKVPRNKNCHTALVNLKKNFENVDLDAFCIESVKIRSGVNEERRNPRMDNVTPYRFHNLTEYNLSKHKGFIESPLAEKLVTSNDFNLTGLDFESTFKQETQFSEEETLRKAKIESRMEKLKRYGEPPPLSAIHITNKSFKIDDSFKSPITEGSRRVNSDQRPHSFADRKSIENHEEIIACANQPSPVLLRNNLVHKSSVNPVKLNFDDSPRPSTHNKKPEGTVSCQNDEDFSEEFDYSPPLSLDAHFL